MPNWIAIFRTQILERLGNTCHSTKELADAISEEIGESISVDALQNAHKRHKQRLHLQESLLSYMATDERAPIHKPEDIFWALSDERRQEIDEATRFLVTSAMNNAPLDARVWESMLTYAEHQDACLLVVPARYKNPTSKGECVNQNKSAWWPSEVTPYLVDELVALHPHLWLMANVRISATAVNPLQGMDTITKDASGIFGHAQLAMRTIPTPQNRLPKILYTTGSVSQPRYSDTKAGITGHFNHSHGGIVVERDQGLFHIRSVTADETGSFYDISGYYTPNRVEVFDSIPAIITGDEHAVFADPSCKAATYLDENSIVQKIKPKLIIRHDVYDGNSINPHTKADPFQQYQKHVRQQERVVDELELTARHIDETTPEGTENLIVWSNHHDFLFRWLKNTNALKEEPWNARIWLELWNEVISRPGEFVDPFALHMSKILRSKATFLEPDSPMQVLDIMIGFHGHNGPNGARGSINNFAKIGAKTIIGHGHSAGINKGCWQVGTSSRLRLGYNVGPSSWIHCHCLIYPNGKRQLIIIINGKWHREEKEA